MKQSKTVFAATLGLILTTAMPAQSAEKVLNYVRDSEGKVVRDGSGKCVRSYDKTTVLLEECGYKKPKKVEKMAAPLPAPKDVVLESVVINNIQFEFDSSNLTAAAKSTIDAMVTKIAAHKEGLRNGTSAMNVTGFTDTSGPESYNQQLSERRANAVADYLAEAHGIPRSSMTVAGKGEANPIADNSTREGRMRNRRVEIDVVTR
jgi:OOP family OmpA-OmpF porin